MEKMSFQEGVMELLKDEITDFTNNGECSGCGNCCTNALPINKDEVDRIKKYIKEHDIKEQVRTTFAEKHPSIDVTCPFRDNKNGVCTIYEVRPKVCRKFNCSKPDEARKNRDKFSSSMKIISCRQTFFR